MARVTRPSVETARAMGRPSEYSDATADAICKRLACGESLRRICSEEAMPSKETVINWLLKDDTFYAKYARARGVQAHVWIDEMKDLSQSDPAKVPMTGAIDSASVAHIRNQVATLQWLAVKLNPKVYGERVDVAHAGNVSIQVVTGIPPNA